MMIWFILAGMTALVVAVFLRALSRPPTIEDAPAAPNEAVYKDQLVEIDSDLKRGLISEQEAEGARAEVARRLLALEDDQRTGTQGGDTASGQATPQPAVIHFGLVVGVVGIALAFYVSLGSPSLQGQPHAERIAARTKAINEMHSMIAAVQQRLKEHPNDGKGWAVIAPIYLRRGQFKKAAEAFDNAQRLLGSRPDLLMGFAKATIGVNKGQVTEAATRAFKTVLKAHPEAPEPQYWIAVSKEQRGDVKGAIADYERLLNTAPSGAPWKGTVARRLAAAKGKSGMPGAPVRTGPPARGPSAADVAAAQKMKPEDQRAMINAMVTGLAQRLKDNGNDPAGWRRLIRSYMVLGQRDKAQSALKDARKALAARKAELKALEAFANKLGLKS